MGGATGPGGEIWAHTGVLGGGTIAFITNTLPVDGQGFITEVVENLPATAARIGTWPSHGLFTQGT